MSETVLRDIGEYKSSLKEPILASEDIRDLLLLGQECPDADWNGDDDNGIEGIMYNQIFPYLYMDETQTEVKAYICYEVDVPRIPSPTIKDIKVIIWCLCHKSAMKVDGKVGYSGNRVDMLADAVERAIREYEKKNIETKKATLGIGKMQLSSVTYMSSINKEYYGRQLIFNVPDFKLKG